MALAAQWQHLRTVDRPPASPFLGSQAGLAVGCVKDGIRN